MIQTVRPGQRSGVITIPASKSAAHRQLICAALSDNRSSLICDGLSKDIEATISCLCSLGASITPGQDAVLQVSPVEKVPETLQELRCGESGSTLRFMLPVAAALGAPVVFLMEGLLSQRPHNALTDVLCAHGAEIRLEGDRMYCSGQLQAGDYEVPGNISSQFVSGLLFALPLLKGSSTLKVTGEIQSAAYIDMTERAIRNAGIVFERKGNDYIIPGNQKYHMPDGINVERDWSNAAFFLCMGAYSEKGITVCGMDTESAQGDRRILEVLKNFGASVEIGKESITVKKGSLRGQVVDAAEIPDLVPVICVTAAGAEGVTRIVKAERLRFKESDRLKSTADMINAMGGTAEETEDGLLITGKPVLHGGCVDPVNDHRIAMAASVAAGFSDGEITVEDAQCVQKSYPGFWDDLNQLEVE